VATVNHFGEFTGCRNFRLTVISGRSGTAVRCENHGSFSIRSHREVSSWGGGGGRLVSGVAGILPFKVGCGKNVFGKRAIGRGSAESEKGSKVDLTRASGIISPFSAPPLAMAVLPY
jgi:hypothetical protein